jgi:hypothetical protein
MGCAVKRISAKRFLVEASIIAVLILVAHATTEYAQRVKGPVPVAAIATASAMTSTSALAQATPSATRTVRATATPSATPTVQPTHTPAPTLAPSTATPRPTAFVGSDGAVYLGERQLLRVAEAAPECARASEISYSPTGEHFLVVLACPNWENEAFLFRADGSDQRMITTAWDFLEAFNYRWAPDGRSFVYRRINSCCLLPDAVPATAPPPGLVRYEIQTGAKQMVGTYRVVRIRSDDTLNVRAGPGVRNRVVGELAPGTSGIEISGEGAPVGDARWVPIQYRELAGWVNLYYLEAAPLP